jgi:hypothetical protein
MKYPLGDSIFRKVEEELFNIIFLEIKNKDLYTATDEYIVNTIDEYTNDKVTTKIIRFLFLNFFLKIGRRSYGRKVQLDHKTT